jgi:hypothetical protein
MTLKEGNPLNHMGSDLLLALTPNPNPVLALTPVTPFGVIGVRASQRRGYGVQLLVLTLASSFDPPSILPLTLSGQEKRYGKGRVRVTLITPYLL